MNPDQDGGISQIPTDSRKEAGSWEADAELTVPGLTLLYHPDLRRVGERVPLSNLERARRVSISRLEPAFGAPGGSRLRPLEDTCLSRSPFYLQRLPGGGLRLDASETKTRVVADGVAVDGDVVFEGESLNRGVVLKLEERVVLLLHLIDPLGGHSLPAFGLIGESPAMLRVRQDIGHVADLSMPVLLRGETGTGKELVARALHRAGSRDGRPFVAVNLGAIPPQLAAAELFGAERGAFTGAERKRDGYFRQAAGGTLFLDEIGEAPPEIQVLLLRALESGEIQPVGARRSERVEVRLVTATDADLAAASERGTFRGPLLYRLGSYEIRLPSLRQHREDFGRLFVHFLDEELEALGERDKLYGDPENPWLPAGLVARLAAFDWPGNVRQLRNVARHLAVASRGSDRVRIRPQIEELLGEPPERPDREPAPPLPGVARKRRPSEIPSREVEAVLRANHWRLGASARQLGIPRSSLYNLIAENPRIRTAGELGRDELETVLDDCGGDLEAAADRLEVSRQALKRRLSELGVRP